MIGPGRNGPRRVCGELSPFRLPRAVPAFAGRDPDLVARPVIDLLDPRLRGEGGNRSGLNLVAPNQNLSHCILALSIGDKTA
jgi:hypothetical protein